VNTTQAALQSTSSSAVGLASLSLCCCLLGKDQSVFQISDSLLKYLRLALMDQVSIDRIFIFQLKKNYFRTLSDAFFKVRRRVVHQSIQLRQAPKRVCHFLSSNWSLTSSKGKRKQSAPPNPGSNLGKSRRQ
jgi:hypothetical protein